jgi:hypothetical protein
MKRGACVVIAVLLLACGAVAGAALQGTHFTSAPGRSGRG